MMPEHPTAIVLDTEDPTTRRVPVNRPDPFGIPDREPGLLGDLPDNGVHGGLPGLDSPAGQGPQPLGWLMTALHEEDSTRLVEDDGTDARDHVHGLTLGCGFGADAAMLALCAPRC